MVQLFLEFSSIEVLLSEVESNLGKGRAFVLGEHDVKEREACELVLVHPLTGEWMPLAAEVVHIAGGDFPGVGLALLSRGPAQTRLLKDFARDGVSSRQPETQAFEEMPVDASLRADAAADSDPLSAPLARSEDEPPVPSSDPLQRASAMLGIAPPTSIDLDEKSAVDVSSISPVTLDAPPSLELPPIPSAAGLLDDSAPLSERSSSEQAVESSSPITQEGVAPPGRGTPCPPQSDGPVRTVEVNTQGMNIHMRVRKMRPPEREKLARTGTITERTALERAFGASLWEALLCNPQLTGPEVARIAKNGGVTQPILGIIVGNTSWISKSEVRRALLSNPRLKSSHIDKILRCVPRAELQKVPKQTAYPARVRMAATKLVG